jgi:integrase
MNKIDEFLVDYTNPKTANSYRTHLNNYFKGIERNPETYFNDDRDYEKDVKKYWREMTNNDTPPLSIKMNLCVVRNFLQDNNVIIDRSTWKKIRLNTKGSRARTMDAAPSNHQLKEILLHGTAKERAIFLIAASSGMRIEEIMELRPGDIEGINLKSYPIEIKSDPVKINIRGETTKTGNPRIAFISNEAKDALIEWYKTREGYIETAIERTKNKTMNGKIIFQKKKDDGRIFPFGYQTARLQWIRLLKKAGYDQKDPSTSRYKMHIHTLRKFFMSRMKLKINTVIVEALCGHEEYLDSAYKRYSQKEIADFYKQGVEAVTVFEVPPDLSDFQKKQEILADENEELKERIQKLESKLGDRTFDMMKELLKKQK